MASKTKLVVATVGLWCVPGTAFGLSMVITGSLGVAAVAAAVGIVVARAALRHSIVALSNDQSVVAIEHPAGAPIDAVEVFWRPGCPFHDGLGRELDKAGVRTNLRNIRESPADAAIVRSIAGGNETVPTLVIGPVALVNPSARLVLATLRAHAPHLLDPDG